MHRGPLLLPVASVLVALLATGCGETPVEPTPEPSARQGPTSGHPLIIDVDLDASDLLAVAILVRDPALDVRALTVSATGLIHCEPGLRVGRGLLDALGRPDVPVACGRETAGGDARPFPEAWREGADRAWGMSLAGAEPDPDPGTAVELISRVAGTSDRPVTIFAAGPLTNVADALGADPALEGRIERLHVMGGVVNALGNVIVGDVSQGDRLEWNFVADPEALGAVFASSVPIDLVPLDATDDVPVPSDLQAWLEEDHAAAGADIAYELLLRFPGRVSDPGSQLWDELAALTVSEPGLVSWDTAGMAAVTSGTLAGRIDRDPAGREVRFANAADRPAVEAALLEALRRGAPRPEPFVLAAEARLRWDGTTCAWAGDPPSAAGLRRLTIENRSTVDGGAFVVAVEAPHTWEELLDFIETFEAEAGTEPPAWVSALAFDLGARAGAQATALVDLPPGISGALCVSGDWPDIELVPGEPLDLPG
jgi:inosine-uridine nucleoside N-ribohydrolase